MKKRSSQNPIFRDPSAKAKVLTQEKKISPDGYNALVSKAQEAQAAGAPGATGEAGIRSVIPTGGSATSMLSSLFGPGGAAASMPQAQGNPLSSLFGGNQGGFQSLLSGGSMPGLGSMGGSSGGSMGGLASLLGGMGGSGGSSGGMGGLASLLGGGMGGGSSGGAASLLGSLFGMREGT